MEKHGTKYYGLVLGNFPILAIIIKNQSAVIRDLSCDYPRMTDFKASLDHGVPSLTCVSFGLLGVKIPLLKLPK